MLMNFNGDDDRRARALKALRSRDESRDDVLQNFVRLTSQALGIPGSFVSVLDDEHQHICAAHNFARSTRPARIRCAATPWTVTAR